MTACGFHDLVGQRVTKIAETLDRVIAKRLNGRHAAVASSALGRSRKPHRPTLNGPALPGEAHSQARIDALFEKN
jgi:hypothetical protein